MHLSTIKFGGAKIRKGYVINRLKNFTIPKIVSKMAVAFDTSLHDCNCHRSDSYSNSLRWRTIKCFKLHIIEYPLINTKYTLLNYFDESKQSEVKAGKLIWSTASWSFTSRALQIKVTISMRYPQEVSERENKFLKSYIFCNCWFFKVFSSCFSYNTVEFCCINLKSILLLPVV